MLPEGALQLLVRQRRRPARPARRPGLGRVHRLGRTPPRKLRTHPTVLHGGVRLGVEADSLNCSILGPDVDRRTTRSSTCSSRSVVTEMTVKAGQKCTAIRRAHRARPRSPTPSSRRSRRGWPRSPSATRADEGVRMGALASLDQRDEVPQGRPGAARRPPRSCTATPTTSRSSTPTPSAARSSPRCCCARRPRARPSRTTSRRSARSAPCSTYDDARRGGRARRPRQGQPGRLAGHPRPGRRPRRRPRRRARGTAGSWSSTATTPSESTGHGSPLPVLVHGGPGRAGGGEELGGIRGVLHHMQRTAVQGSPDMLTAITGRWIDRRRARTDDGVHPFRKTPGRAARSATRSSPAPRTVTLEDIEHFAEFTGDTFYAHTDEEAAAANPLFGGIVAHGYLVVSLRGRAVRRPRPRARCWPTSASTTCASSPRSRPATRSR